MRTSIRKKNFAKLAFIVVSVGVVMAFLVLSGGQKAHASSAGPSPSHTDAPGEDNCTACHVDFPVNSGKGSVKISGVPRVYYPGQHLRIKVTTSQDDRTAYGFQLTAIDSEGRPAGTWTLDDPIQTQIVEGFVGQNLRQYVEHTSAGIVPVNFGSKSWTFTWNAPIQNVGAVGFYAAGNAVNGNGSTDGDYIYTTFRMSIPGSVAFDRSASRSDQVADEP